MQKSKIKKKSKFIKIFGYFFIIFGVLATILYVTNWIDWNQKKDNYTKQCAYSNGTSLYYKVDEQTIYVNKIFNTSDEKIDLDIPNGKSVILYSNNSNVNECIYFDMDNSNDAVMLEPIQGVFVLFFIGIGVYFASGDKNAVIQGNLDMSPRNLRWFGIFFFVIGMVAIIGGILENINNLSISSQDNRVTATIYSEIHSYKTDIYKPVAKYSIDDKEYIYVSDTYVDGQLEENLYTTIELYYDQNDYNKVVPVEQKVQIKIIIYGLLLAFWGFPFAFRNKKMQQLVEEYVETAENDEDK